MIKPGTVVQLDPDNCKNPMLRGCFMTVTEVKEWGVQGYIQCTGTNNEMGGQAYYRAKTDEFEIIGGAVWIME